MNRIFSKWLYLAAGGVGTLVITGAALFAYTQAAEAAQAVPAQVFQARQPGDGPGGRDGMDEALAAALGISVEELQAAHEAARAAALEQEVADGTLTQEQADSIAAGERPTEGTRPAEGVRGPRVDIKPLLAEELGISVEELEAAQQQARETALVDALANGEITQEQADLMQAHMALRPYMEEAMTSAREAAINAAVADGAITEAQAQLLRANPGRGGHRGGPGGFGGPAGE